MENELCYGISFPVEDEVLKDDFVLPIGKAKIEHEGKDITIVACGIGVKLALEAADQLKTIGVNAEVKIFFKINFLRNFYL